jgi:hypothetical protein
MNDRLIAYQTFIHIFLTHLLVTGIAESQVTTHKVNYHCYVIAQKALNNFLFRANFPVTKFMNVNRTELSVVNLE